VTTAPTTGLGPGAPRGLRWRITTRFTLKSRQRRFELFMDEIRPTAEDRVLDVGVVNTTWRGSNFMESLYPWPEQITAVAPAVMPAFAAAFPAVRFITADGRDLPFADGEFDIGFSNAVLEHVGTRDDQRRFVAEMVRTCRRVFLSTPNAGFPIDPHTLLPLAHWLPRRVRHPVLRLTGNGRWADERVLNPLGGRDLIGLFPESCRVRLVRQRVLGLTTVLIAVANRPDSP
jgi:hypothetical protein